MVRKVEAARIFKGQQASGSFYALKLIRSESDNFPR